MYFIEASASPKILRADLNGTNVEELVTMGLSAPFSIALDMAGDKMYWVNTGNPDKIMRADLDGNNVEDLVTTGLSEPRYIALDIGAGKMYWTEEGGDKIRRADLNGDNVEDLVTSSIVFRAHSLDISPAGPEPIPALSQWGFLILAIVFIIVGTVALYQRETKIEYNR